VLGFTYTSARLCLLTFVTYLYLLCHVTITCGMMWCDQVKLCQLADQRVVVDQLKQITLTLSNLVGADSTADIRHLTDVDMDKYVTVTQTFSDKSHQLDAVYRQANDVTSFSMIVSVKAYEQLQWLLMLWRREG